MPRIRLFAGARVAAGTGADEIDGATVGEVLDAAVARYGGDFAGLLDTCRIWVDGEPAERDDPVSAGAEVAVLPPVSGGSVGPMIPDLQRVLDPSYLAGLAQVGADQLRAMRAECADLENGVSYVRRLTQGRLDLLAEEARRRADGGGGDLADLVARLPELLSDGVRAPASGRASADLDPPESVVGPLTERLDAVVPRATLGGVADLDDAALAAAAESLRGFEDELSTSRRDLHTSIDTLNDELARRIAAGEVSPPGAQ